SVQQAEPQVEVSQAEPDVSVQQAEPDVSVRQAEPEVSVRQAEPAVEVRHGEPSVRVGQAPRQAQSQQGPKSQSQPAQQSPSQQGQQSLSEQQRQAEARQQAERETTEFTTELNPQEIVGNNVVTPQGETIGEISGVARSRTDSEMHALIDVGGFLGLGERTVALPMDRLERNQDGDVVTQMSREELEQLPEYDSQDYAAIEDESRILQ